MFSIGDTVVHPGEGICTVVDIRTEEFVKGAPREYYFLQPQGQPMTVYLPVDQTRVPLRTPMTAAEAETLTERAAAADGVWCDDERERQSRVTHILHEAQPVPLMRLVQDLKAEQRRRAEHGKKLRFTDEHALQNATTLLRRELTAVLGESAAKKIV